MRTFLALLLTAFATQAANIYCDPSGSGSGTTFSDLATLPNGTGWTRGDTYVIIEGSYGSRDFDEPTSGTTGIKIRRANAAQDSGVAGWSPTLVDSPSEFTSWDISTSYWEIDGITGQWASDIPGYEAHGIKVTRISTGDNQKVIRIGASGVTPTQVTIRHVEASFGMTPRTGNWHRSLDVLNTYGSFQTISYCWFHDAGRVVTLWTGTDDVVVEYSVLERSGQGQVAEGFNPSEHSELVMMQPDADRITYRYNYLRDWRSTGGLIHYTENQDIKIHGNIFEDTGYYAVPGEANDSNGAINGLGAGTGYTSETYNNTFVNLRYGASLYTQGSWTSRNTSNNLFYNCHRLGGDGSLVIGGTHDYNWFFDVGTVPTEANGQTGSGDPFVSLAGENYRLASGTTAGDATIGSEFQVDRDGNTRGSDGTWDRGAFEFFSGSDTTPPDLGTITIVTNATSFVVSFTANEAVTNVFKWGLTTSYGSTLLDHTFDAFNSRTASTLEPSTEYHFQIIAGDAAGNETTTSDMRVDTLALDETAPMITLDEPDEAEAISGAFGMQATATDDTEMLIVEFFVDGTKVGEDTDTGDSIFNFNWDSRTVADGEYDIWARAEDTSSNEAFSATNSVTVTNIVTGGLVAHWQFSSGSLTADSVGTNTLTLVGDATSGTGKAGAGLVLDGTDDRATAVNGPDVDYAGDQITVGCWLNVTATGTWQQPVVKIQSTGSNQSAWHIYLGHESSTEARGYWEVRNAADTKVFVSAASTIPYGEWVHLVGVYDGLDLRVYVNGIPSEPVSQTGNLQRYAQPLFIGSHGNGTEDVSGTLDDVRIYNIALTGPQVLAWFQSTEDKFHRGRATPGLLSIGVGP